MPQKKLHIAMLEDDSDDRYLTKEIIEDLDFDLHIDFFSNSNDLLAGVAATKPHLILADFNSTPENALQVLRNLKTDGSYKSIPFIILSDSNASKYRNECYGEGAGSFITKPNSLEETKQKIKSFFTYWTEVAEL